MGQISITEGSGGGQNLPKCDILAAHRYCH